MNIYALPTSEIHHVVNITYLENNVICISTPILTLLRTFIVLNFQIRIRISDLFLISGIPQMLFGILN